MGISMHEWHHILHIPQRQFGVTAHRLWGCYTCMFRFVRRILLKTLAGLSDSELSLPNELCHCVSSALITRMRAAFSFQTNFSDVYLEYCLFTWRLFVMRRCPFTHAYSSSSSSSVFCIGRRPFDCSLIDSSSNIRHETLLHTVSVEVPWRHSLSWHWPHLPAKSSRQ